MIVLRLCIFVLVVGLSAIVTAAELRQLAIIDIPGRPGFDDVALLKGNLIIAHRGEGSVEVFDTAKRRVVAQVKGLDGPRCVVADERTGRVFVGNADGQTISVISSKDWKVEDTIPLHAAPYALALSPDGSRLYSANWRDRSVTVLEVGRGYRHLANVPLDGTPADIFVDPHGLVYATLQDRREVVSLDNNFRVSRRYPLQASQPTGVIADDAGKRLFIAVRFAVVALDADTGSELARAAAPAGVNALWFEPSTETLYAVADGTVSIFTTKGGLRVLDEIRTDVKGHTIAFDPSRRQIFIPGGREGRSKLLILRRLEANPQDGLELANR